MRLKLLSPTSAPVASPTGSTPRSQARRGSGCGFSARIGHRSSAAEKHHCMPNCTDVISSGAGKAPRLWPSRCLLKSESDAEKAYHAKIKPAVRARLPCRAAAGPRGAPASRSSVAARRRRYHCCTCGGGQSGLGRRGTGRAQPRGSRARLGGRGARAVEALALGKQAQRALDAHGGAAQRARVASTPPPGRGDARCRGVAAPSAADVQPAWAPAATQAAPARAQRGTRAASAA